MSTSKKNNSANKRSIPDGVWIKCEKCKAVIFEKEFSQLYKVCSKCDFHHRLNIKERIIQLLDPNTFKEISKNLKTKDHLKFKVEESYSDYYEKNRKKTGINEAIIIGKGKLEGNEINIGIMDFRFMGGSMGSVVGEKVSILIEAAIKNKKPLIIITASGGARMHEGMISLMQMAKTSLYVGKLRDKKVPFIVLLTNPTTGGVLASFASQADIIIAEPHALIGFTGPRVIEKTIKQRLPEGFQTSEFLLKHGMIDLIVKRVDQKEIVGRLINFFGG